MQITHDASNNIEIKLTRAEAIKLLLIVARAGIEHTPTGTTPITVDVTTGHWTTVFEWAKSNKNEIIHSLRESEFEILLSHFVTVRGDGFNIL